MTTLYGSLRLRPTRIGFLVRPTDLNAIRTIMRLCTCLWGGAFNPIIPVCRALPTEWKDHPRDRLTGAQMVEGYLQFFEPDVFVEASPGLAKIAGIDADGDLLWQPRVVGLKEFVQRDEHGEAEFAFGLNICDLYRSLYEKEFQFAARRERRLALFEPGSPDDAFITAACGAFPSDTELSFVQRAYCDVFEPTQLRATASDWIRVLNEGFRTPRYLTRHNIDVHPGGRDDPTLFIVDPTSPLDLIDIWNVRQFRANVLPINLHWIDAVKDFLRQFIKENHRPLPGNPHGVMIHTTVQFGRSISEDRVREIKASALTDLPDRSFGFRLHYDRLQRGEGSDMHGQLSRARLTADSTNLELMVSEGDELAIRFRALHPEFAAQFGSSFARWINVLTLRDYGRSHGLALYLPSNVKKVEYPHMRFGEGLIASREGFVLPQRHKENDDYINLMTGRQAIADWLSNHGVQADPSDPGRIADQVLNAVGGTRGLHVLADEETLKKLNDMARNLQPRADGATTEYPDRTAPVNVWEGIVKRRKETRSGPEVTLDDMVKAGILKLGLAVRCTNCEKVNWYGLADLSDRVQCERCLKSFIFPQGSLNFKNTPWQYRVVGAFSIPDYARGSYATVLALRVFARNLGPGESAVTYTTSLSLRAEDQTCEIDFALWFGQHRIVGQDGRLVPVVGEAKCYADEGFKADDVRRLRRLAPRLPESFFVFATLKRELSANERELIGRFALWGRVPLEAGRPRAPVIVLTGTELFSDRYIYWTWKKSGGLRAKLIERTSVRMDNLWTLANFTQQVYLGLPDYYQWYEDRIRRGQRTRRRQLNI